MTQLSPNRCQLALNGIRFNVFRVRPELGTPIEAISDEQYWAHVSHQFSPGDKIEIFPDDKGYWAEFLVIDAGKLYAKVKLVSLADFTIKESVGDIPEGYEVKHRGPKGWCVLRGTDVLGDKLGDKESAIAWLQDHLKAA